MVTFLLGILASLITVTYFPPNLFLVRVTTVDVSKYDSWKKGDNRVTFASFKVTAVVAGPEKLKGQTFQCEINPWNPPSGPYRRTMRDVYVAEPGAEGLWWVTHDPKYQMVSKGWISYDAWQANRYTKESNKSTLRPELRGAVVDTYVIRQFPYQKTKGADSFYFGGPEMLKQPADIWKEGNAWAEAVGNVYNAGIEKRPELLKKYAQTPNSPIAEWAVSFLAYGNPTAHIKFLKQLTQNEKLKGKTLAQVDRILCKIDLKEWTASDDRLRMFNRLLKDPKDWRSFDFGIGRLEEASRVEELDFSTYKKLLDPLLVDDGPLNHNEMSYTLGRAFRGMRVTSANRVSVFNWLVGYVGNADAVSSVKSEAVRGLGRLHPFSAQELATLQALRRNVKDPKVQEAFDKHVLKSSP